MIDAFVTDGFDARQRSCWLLLRWIFAAVLFAPVRRVAVSAFIPVDQSFQELLLTPKIRHSSAGWNPVHRIFKHLDGLGPSLRWDDGVIRSSLQVNPGTGALFRDKTRWDPRQCCCFNSGP